MKSKTIIFLGIFLLFFLFAKNIFAACYECERDHPGICNLPDRGPIINAFVARNCYTLQCTWADACAPHTIPGADCSTSTYIDIPSLRLTRYSNGEAYNGSFVGCNNNNQNQNCFCNIGASLYGNVSGTVRCVDDAYSDSCAARVTPAITATPTVSFNGIVLDPNGGNRWSSGTLNCASHIGVTVTSTLGNLYWVPNDGYGGHFDVANVPTNSTVTIKVAPPKSCNLDCGTWSTDDGAYTGTGCEATFPVSNTDWGRNVHFRLKPLCTPNCSCAANTCIGNTCSDGCGGICQGTKPRNCTCATTTCVNQTCSDGCGGTCAGQKPQDCTWTISTITNPTCGGPTRKTEGSPICGATCPTIYDGCRECETCSDQCGQAMDCGGFCFHPDCNLPSAPTIVRPANSKSSPYLLESSSINLTWNDPATPNDFTHYNLHIYDETANTRINCTNTSSSSFCETLSPSVHNYRFPMSGALIKNHLYHWWIDAEKNCPCSQDINEGPSAGGYFIYSPNTPPRFTELIIKNSVGETVPPETADPKNHICQTAFGGDRTPTFIVKAADDDGQTDITNIELQWNGHSFFRTDLTNGTATFTETLDNNLNSSSIYMLQANITDSRGATTNWVSTGRQFKIWDCEVPVSGAVYDGSSEELGPTCNASSFDKPISSSINYSLYYRHLTNDYLMNVDSPGYNSNRHNLIWGYSYNSFFDIPAQIEVLKTTDLGDQSVGTVCPSTDGILVLSLDNNHVNPYSTNPSIRADFSTVIDQEPWYQVSGGGINSVQIISDIVPPTCNSPNCIPAISKRNDSDLNDNGCLIARSIEKGCETCAYGSPNNTHVEMVRTALSENYDYKYFYSQFVNKSFPGKYYNDASNPNAVFYFSNILNDLGGTGVAIVNGSLNIDAENSLNDNQFLMVVVKNNITFDQSINNVSGVFVANGAINANGVSDTQLNINGVLYSVNSTVTLFRKRTPDHQNLNNDQPSVSVNYLPSLIFNMPGNLVNTFTYWKAGI
jgi:hypothetical protein